MTTDETKQIRKYTRVVVSVEITDDKYADMLVIGLARQGHSPYFSEGNKEVCFEITGEDLRPLADNI
jgi:hypothetical protein